MVGVEEAAVGAVVFVGPADASSGRRRKLTGCFAICCGIDVCMWSQFCMLASVMIGWLVDVGVVAVAVLVEGLSLAWGLETFLVVEKLGFRLYNSLQVAL